MHLVRTGRVACWNIRHPRFLEDRASDLVRGIIKLSQIRFIKLCI